MGAHIGNSSVGFEMIHQHHNSLFTPAPLLLSHVAHNLRQSEADVSGLLPAAADLSELSGHAGQEKDQAAQQHHEWEDQDQCKSGGQVEMVLGSIEGTVPSE